MLLSLVLHTYSMRYVLPAAVMMGTAPTYVLAWGAWRLLSAVLPARFYREVDDRLYTIYQSMVLFFFENYTGVQVSRAGTGTGGGAGGAVLRPGRRRPPFASPQAAAAGGSAGRARPPPPPPPCVSEVGGEESGRRWQQVRAVACPRRGLRIRRGEERRGESRSAAAVATERWCCVRFRRSGRRKGCDGRRALPALEWQPALAARTLWPVLHVCSVKLAADKKAVVNDNHASNTRTSL